MKKLEVKANIKIYSFKECDDQKLKLIEAAQKATQTSYSPYSNFKVGCAALLENGELIVGSNQENAAYTNGLCAERTALFYANSKFPSVAIKMIAIAAYTKDDYTTDVCTPCGSCRQVLLEIENRFRKPITIIMTSKEQAYEVDSIKELLPLSFGKENL